MYYLRKDWAIAAMAGVIMLAGCATSSQQGPQAKAAQAHQVQCATQTGSMLSNHCTAGVSSTDSQASRRQGATSAQGALTGRQTSAPSALAGGG
ncbi:hypothetical protein V5738_06000 [Salinisphaera sp. SPP-AMP-43]|uniref:hypothetical protein n=1 Tax=Salinisphaera sp. SPP-AMP-43 TaxID=3121288 RepID=UPI003C6E5F56